MFSFVLLFLFQACLSLNMHSKHYDHIKKMNKIYENNPENPYPNQNFLFLQKTINELSTGEEVTISTASGVVFEKNGNTMYGLTAAHWCVTIDDPEFSIFSGLMGYDNLDVAKNAIKLKADFFGLSHDIRILDMDIDNDICLFELESKYASQAKKIKIATVYPKIGEKVHTISAPFGIKGPSIRLHFEGYFSGCVDDSIECFYTLPGTFGSSGSGILNKDGELIGVLTISVRHFNNVTGGAKLEDIKAIIDSNI